MMEGTSWQGKLENITIDPRENFIIVSKIFCLFSVLLFAEPRHITYLIGFSHRPREEVKVDVITSKQRQGK